MFQREGLAQHAASHQHDRGVASRSCVLFVSFQISVFTESEAHRDVRAPVSAGLSRREHWGGLPRPPPGNPPDPNNWMSTWTSQVAPVVKNPPATAGDIRDACLIPESGRSPGGGNGNPIQYSCLENPMDRGAWQAMVHSITKS